MIFKKKKKKKKKDYTIRVEKPPGYLEQPNITNIFKLFNKN